GPVVKEGDSQSSAIEEWPDWTNRRIARNKNCEDQDQIACGRDPGTDADLCQVVRLSTPHRLATPDPEHQRHTHDAGKGIERLVPGDRDAEAAKVRRDMRLNPHRIHVVELRVSR